MNIQQKTPLKTRLLFGLLSGFIAVIAISIKFAIFNLLSPFWRSHDYGTVFWGTGIVVVLIALGIIYLSIRFGFSRVKLLKTLSLNDFPLLFFSMLPAMLGLTIIKDMIFFALFWL